jgi:hypothetical protein
MSNFLLNLLVQISKALVNLKIQFLIQKFLFFAFGPTDLAAHSVVGQPAPLASLLPQAGPSRSAHARRWRNCKSTLSPLIHAFRSRRLLSIHR